MGTRTEQESGEVTRPSQRWPVAGALLLAALLVGLGLWYLYQFPAVLSGAPLIRPKRHSGGLNLPPPTPGWSRRVRIARRNRGVFTHVVEVAPNGRAREIALGRAELNAPRFILDRWLQDFKDREMERRLRRGDPRWSSNGIDWLPVPGKSVKVR